jgi:hypothetical protein
VPLARVNLAPYVPPGIDFVPGPRAREVVRNQDEWARLWKTIGDTIPLPPIELGDSVLVVVASEQFPDGPARVEIEDLRVCRRTGDLVAFLRLHTQQALNDYPDRSIRAVLVGRSRVGDRAVQFVDLPADVQP